MMKHVHFLWSFPVALGLAMASAQAQPNPEQAERDARQKAMFEAIYPSERMDASALLKLTALCEDLLNSQIGATSAAPEEWTVHYQGHGVLFISRDGALLMQMPETATRVAVCVITAIPVSNFEEIHRLFSAKYGSSKPIDTDEEVRLYPQTSISTERFEYLFGDAEKPENAIVIAVAKYREQAAVK